MTEQDRNKAWGFSLFGDDVRFEMGGKSSLMGIYQSDMVFPNSVRFPIILSKFVIQINYFELVGTIEGDLSFRVTYGSQNTPIAEMAILRKDILAMAATIPPPDSSEDSERVFNMRLPIVLSPFNIPEMGRIRVRAHYADGRLLKLGSIAVKQIPDDEFRSLTGLPILSQS